MAYSENFKKFIEWEAASLDTIDFKKIYCDVAGDVLAGLLLSQLIYFYLPDKTKKRSKLRVLKQGIMWIAKAREDWWDECRLSPKQVDHALKILADKGIIVKKLFRFNGSPTLHIRLDEEAFMSLLVKELEKGEKSDQRSQRVKNQAGQNDSDFNQTSKSISTKREYPSYRKVKMESDQKAKTLTKTTTQTTTKTTTKRLQSHALHETDCASAQFVIGKLPAETSSASLGLEEKESFSKSQDSPQALSAAAGVGRTASANPERGSASGAAAGIESPTSDSLPAGVAASRPAQENAPKPMRAAAHELLLAADFVKCEDGLYARGEGDKSIFIEFYEGKWHVRKPMWALTKTIFPIASSHATVEAAIAAASEQSAVAA